TEKIGEGLHGRYIIDTEKFLTKINDKHPKEKKRGDGA
ncbi:MAG: hypothetical protein PWQ12_1506, partial [Clostridiales bacterium]|nr:hypothetical protein [Clostridiales bacterium]